MILKAENAKDCKCTIHDCTGKPIPLVQEYNTETQEITMYIPTDFTSIEPPSKFSVLMFETADGDWTPQMCTFVLEGSYATDKDGKKIGKKTMNVREFIELGLLQEVNRLFLHPRGLALEVVLEDDGSEHFGEIWDQREDPEGIIFSNTPSRTKARHAIELLNAKTQNRLDRFGWVNQPI